MTLRGESPGNGFVNAHPMAHHRWLPSIEKGAPDSLSELISSGSARFEGGRPGAATPHWNYSSRPPRNWPGSRSPRSSRGYYRQVGVTWDGGHVLAERGVRDPSR